MKRLALTYSRSERHAGIKALSLGGVLLLTVSLCAAQKPHPWSSCKVIKQEISTRNAGAAAIPIGTSVVAVPLTQTSNQIIIESTAYRYTLIEKPSKHYLVLPENASVQFYQDGKWFVFLDSEKKEHKFSVMHMEKLP